MWFLDKGGALVAVKQPSVPTSDLWYVHKVNCLSLLPFLNCFIQFPTAIFFRLIQCLWSKNERVDIVGHLIY